MIDSERLDDTSASPSLIAADARLHEQSSVDSIINSMDTRPYNSSTLEAAKVWDNMLLGSSLADIKTLTLPQKIIHRLILENLGLYQDQRYFFYLSGITLKKHDSTNQVSYLRELIEDLKNLAGWENENFGISLATMSDRLGGELPSLQIKRNFSIEEMGVEISNFERQIMGVKNISSDWSEIMFHLYMNPWNRIDRVAGIRLNFQTYITLPKVNREDVYVLEIIPGKWPRNLSYSTPGKDHYYYRQGSGYFGDGGFVRRGDKIEEKYPDLTIDQITLVNIANELLNRNYLTNPNTRSQVSRLQQLESTSDVTLDMCLYLSPDPKIGLMFFAFDYDVGWRPKTADI